MNAMKNTVTNNRCAFIAIIIAVALLSSCGTNQTDESKLVSTYARVIIERESGLDSTVTAHRVDSIVRSAGFTRESFSEALRSHGNSAVQLRQFYDSVSAELNRMRSDSSR